MHESNPLDFDDKPLGPSQPSSPQDADENLNSPRDSPAENPEPPDDTTSRADTHILIMTGLHAVVLMAAIFITRAGGTYPWAKLAGSATMGFINNLVTNANSVNPDLITPPERIG